MWTWPSHLFWIPPWSHCRAPSSCAWFEPELVRTAIVQLCDNGDGPVLHMGIPLASHSLCCKAKLQQSCFLFVFSCLWERVTISLSPWSGLSCTPWSAKQALSELVQLVTLLLLFQRVNKSRAFLITEVLFFHSLLAYMQQQGKLLLLLHIYSWKS